MTLDQYGHLFGDRLDVVADAMDAARASALADVSPMCHAGEVVGWHAARNIAADQRNCLRPRRDSNSRSRLRRAVLYPLSYGGLPREQAAGRTRAESNVPAWPRVWRSPGAGRHCRRSILVPCRPVGGARAARAVLAIVLLVLTSCVRQATPSLAEQRRTPPPWPAPRDAISYITAAGLETQPSAAMRTRASSSSVSPWMARRWTCRHTWESTGSSTAGRRAYP